MRLGTAAALALAASFVLSQPVASQQVCTPDETHLCLDGQRFSVEVAWKDFQGGMGFGHVVPFPSDDSGLFWFFDRDNWELLVKIVDGCSVNGNRWVFAAASTNVEYELRIRDLRTGEERQYRNEGGVSARPVIDTEAFSDCTESLASSTQPGAAAGSTRKPDPYRVLFDQRPFLLHSACPEGPRIHCLEDKRFRVAVRWEDFEGKTGFGRTAVARSDDSGLFWFFDPDNWELLVKVIDGCPVNGHFWVLGAATTTVEYEIEVTDTVTGEQRTYRNPLGVPAPAITDTTAFTGCGREPEADVVISSDRMVVLSRQGDTAVVEAKAVRTDGTTVPGAAVAWASSDESQVEVEPLGGGRARITRVSQAAGSAVVSAGFRGRQADVQVILGETGPSTVMLPSRVVVATSGRTLTVSRGPETEGIGEGDVLISGPDLGLLARVVRRTDRAGLMDLEVEPVGLADAFEELDLQVVGRLPAPASGGVTRIADALESGCKALVGGGVELGGLSFHDGDPHLGLLIAADIKIEKLLRVTELTVLVRGQASVEVGVDLELEGEIPLSGVRCVKKLGTVPAGTAFILGIPLSASVDVGLGFELRPTLGPVFTFSDFRLGGGGEVTVGIEYRRERPEPWRFISESDWDTTVVWPSIEFGGSERGAELRLFGIADVGLGLISFFESLSVRLSEVELGGYLDVELQGSLDPASAAYRGPTWEAGGDLKLRAKAELGGRAMRRLLGYFNIDRTPSASFPLFSKRFRKFGSPILEVKAVPTMASVGESVGLTLTSSWARRGTADFFSDRSTGGGLLELVGTADGVGGAISSWRPGAEDVGRRKLFGRWQVELDPISAVLPYAAAAPVEVVVEGPEAPVPEADPPRITGVSPNPVTGSDSQQPFTINGRDFQPGPNVTLRDLRTGEMFSNRSISSFSSTRIVINPRFTTAAATWTVEVINSDGKSSGPFSFQVIEPQGPDPEPAPRITGVSPNPVTGSDSQQPFTINGRDFQSGANVTLRDRRTGEIFPNRSTSSFSSTRIVINPNFTTAAATWTVEVINPDGKSSGEFFFQVAAPAAPAPRITSVSPNPVTGSNSSQPFTINGRDFQSGANVTLRVPRTGEVFPNRSISSLSSTRIFINPNFTTQPDTWSVEVINPDGKSSGQFFFLVVAP